MSAQLAIGYVQTAARARIPRGALLGGVAALLISLILADARIDNDTTAASSMAVPVVGEFTGAYQDGVPVYRLPPIVVIGSRGAQGAQPGRTGG